MSAERVDAKRGVRTAFCLFFALLLTVMLTATALVAAAMLTLCPEDAVTRNITEEFVQGTLQDVRKDWNQLGAPARIPADVLNGVLTEEDVRAEVASYVQNAWNGTEHVSRRDEIAVRLKLAVSQFVISQEGVLSDEVEPLLESFVELCMERYAMRMTLPFFPNLCGAVRMVLPLLPYAGGIALAGTLVVGGLLWGIRKTSTRFFRYSTYALWGSALTFLLPALYVGIDRPYARLEVHPIYVREVYVRLVDTALHNVWWIGAAWVALGAAACVTACLLQKKENRAESAQKIEKISEN